jgi:hypothetical protein
MDDVKKRFNDLEQHLFIKYAAQVVTKSTKWTTLWRVIDVVYRILTLNKVKKASTRYVTTLGPYIFYPAEWQHSTLTVRDYVTLRHEAIHLEQYNSLCKMNIWLGSLLFTFLYFFMFFPIGLAYFRYRYERQAYVTTFLVGQRFGIIYNPEAFVTALTGSAYLWAWPFKKSVRAYFAKHCKTAV